MPNEIPHAVPGKTPTIPPCGKTSAIDIEDVRYFIYDRTPKDNPLLLDIEYSDNEVLRAQRFTAMFYNDMEPKVDYIDPATIPRGLGSIFLYGIAYHLLNAKLLQLERNDVTYEAGNMTVNINRQRIEALRAQVPRFQEEFQRLAASRKRSINVAAAFRTLGGGWNSYGGW